VKAIKIAKYPIRTALNMRDKESQEVYYRKFAQNTN